MIVAGKTVRAIAWLWVILSVPGPTALGQERGTLRLENETTLLGTIVDQDDHVLVRSSDGSEKRVAKYRIARMEGGALPLWLEMAISGLLTERDPGEVSRLREAILAKDGVTPELLREVLEKPDRRPPRQAGRTVEPITIRGTDKKTEYVLVVPEGYDPSKPWPLWISMHGTGGRGSHCASFLESVTQRRGILLACPTEHEEQHGKGWGYSDDERELTLSVLEDVKRLCHVDTNRVYLNGWSRGGHAAYDVADHYPDKFAAINPVIGAPRARYFGLLRNLEGIGVTILNGAKDDPLLVQAARHGVDLLSKRLELDVVYDEDPEQGHVLFLDKMPGVTDYLLHHTRDPDPDHLVIAGYDPKYAERAWLKIEAFDDDAYAPGKQVRIKGISDRWSDSRKLEAFQEAVYDGTAFATGDRKDNFYSIKTEGITQLTIRLPDSINWDRSIIVKVNGRSKHRGKVEGETAYLLDHLIRTRDRQQVYWNEITVDV
ncbi:MAG: PHB depolymerase family esterase [Planctomycetota bacterium]